jgi:hypothetical protein
VCEECAAGKYTTLIGVTAESTCLVQDHNPSAFCVSALCALAGSEFENVEESLCQRTCPPGNARAERHHPD